MVNNTIYFKQTSEETVVTDNVSEADFVQVPAEEYISLKEWNELIDEYELLRNQYEKVMQLDRYKLSAKEGMVTISEATYHGYLNCLRILRDRSLQQINKSIADSHGYSTKYCEERIFDRNYPDLKAFMITKSTPISLKIDLQAAAFLINQDLKDFYNFIDLNAIELYTEVAKIKISAHDLLLACKQRDDPDYSFDFYVDNSEQGRMIKTWLDSADKAISFEVARITSNIGQGVYDITYWATGPI